MSITRECLKKDKDGNLSPATGCKGWSSQPGGRCCEPEKEESSGFLGGLVKVLSGVAAGVAIPAIVPAIG